MRIHGKGIIIRSIMAVLLALTAIIFSSCGGNEPKPEKVISDQELFQGILGEYKTMYEEGTSLQKDTARKRRGEKLKELLAPKNYAFEAWEATVLDVDSNMVIGLHVPKRSIILTLSIGPLGQLTNKTLGFSANLPPEAITEESPLYNVAIDLAKGQNVLVSGRFLLNSDREPLETNHSTEPSMVQPVFAVEITQINQK
jgi:hypothetical protein